MTETPTIAASGLGYEVRVCGCEFEGDEVTDWSDLLILYRADLGDKICIYAGLIRDKDVISCSVYLDPGAVLLIVRDNSPQDLPPMVSATLKLYLGSQDGGEHKVFAKVVAVDEDGVIHTSCEFPADIVRNVTR